MLRKRKREIKRKFSQGTDEQKLVYTERRKLIDQHIENHIKERKQLKVVKIAGQIKSEKGFDGGAFWEFKKHCQGKKTETIEAIKNELGELQEEPTKILEVYRSYYQHLLNTNEMTTQVGKEIETLIDRYINELGKQAKRDGISPFTEEEYQEVKKRFKER